MADPAPPQAPAAEATAAASSPAPKQPKKGGEAKTGGQPKKGGGAKKGTDQKEGDGKKAENETQAAAPTAEADLPNASGDKVTPFEAKSKDAKGIDYQRLVTLFGTQLLDDDILARFARLSKKPLHPFLTRKLFYSHRSLDELLNAVEKGHPFYLYTGRGPSSEALHLGHLIPFIFTKYLQEAFGVPLVIQLTDDEKFLWKQDLTLDGAHRLAIENAKDIISVGFDPKNTFIFSDLDYVGHMYSNIVKIERCITANQVQSALGLTGEDNIGKYSYTAIQAAPSFSSSFETVLGAGKRNVHCLIPCAIDQDPFFRMTRDVAPRIGCIKPAVIHSKFFPALTGLTEKMSASSPTNAIYVTDTPKQIQDKINKYAFSGGRDTLEEQRRLGANLEVDVPYQWLRVFMEDDVRLQQIHDGYGTGKMLTGEVKQELIGLIQGIVADLQKRRATITDDLVKEFMRVRPLEPLKFPPAAPAAKQ
jgi:tryptophanyl-tRNA synthetase